MPLSDRYVLMQDLESYFVDKTTGEPLANGKVYFYRDNNRNTLKPVYMLTGAPPNYTYSPLPNPMTLSGVGTADDGFGNNIAIYWKPYSDLDPTEIDLYFVRVFDQDGNEQFTREAWPNISAGNSANEGVINTSNELSNSQFVDVLFNPENVLTVSYTGNGTKSVDIAPGWILELGHTNGGSVTVERIPVPGNLRHPTNPPYLLEIVGGNNLTSLNLVQRLYENPDIWSPSVANDGGFVASTILLGPGTTNVEMKYRPSDSGTEQTLLTASNNSGNYVLFSDTVQLIPGDNTDEPGVIDGYVDIVVSLPVLGTSRISSVQVVGMDFEQEDVPYDQQPANRQRDFLAHYYKPLLAYKPIPSYLTGWDFPLNPSQFYADGARAAQAIGINKSEYKWDQTIIFQSANSGVVVARGNVDELVVSANVDTQFALVQYLDEVQARKILNDRIAVNVSCSTSLVAGVTGTVSLYWTDDLALPDVSAGTNNSIVLTLDANGKPATFNGTWNEVPRSDLGNATFEVQETVTDNFFDYSFNGWDMLGDADIETVKFFAIVVGFATVTAGQSVRFNSISACAGDIATRPAPKTPAETLLDCQQFYWKTFLPNVTPADNIGLDTGELNYLSSQAGANSNFIQSMYFPSLMRATPDITFYNPKPAGAGVTNGQVWNESNLGSSASVTVSNTTTRVLGFWCQGNGAGGVWGAPPRLLAVHVVADARPGIV